MCSQQDKVSKGAKTSQFRWSPSKGKYMTRVRNELNSIPYREAPERTAPNEP